MEFSIEGEADNEGEGSAGRQSGNVTWLVAVTLLGNIVSPGVSGMLYFSCTSRSQLDCNRCDEQLFLVPIALLKEFLQFFFCWLGSIFFRTNVVGLRYGRPVSV